MPKGFEVTGLAGFFDGLELSIEDAEKMTVPFGREKTDRTLKWIADNHPAALDRLLEENDPEDGEDTLIFYALVLVNQKYEKRIAEALRNPRSEVKKKIERPLILPSILHSALFEYEYD